MTFKSFLKLVELPTKVASVFPFLVGTTYALYRFGQLNTNNLLLMFLAMICLDMATTALNNYMDYKKAIRTHGFNYEEHNAMVSFGLGELTVKLTIAVLAMIAMVLGLILFLQTDLVVLLLGMVSFFFAATYTTGPLPISRTPLGELVSGTAMGGIITFISFYIHVFEHGIITYAFNGLKLSLQLDIIELVAIVFVVLPLITGISNIMLANNTCDMEDDYENKRYTLPIVIGKAKALQLFGWLYLLGYLGIVIAVIAKWLPITCLIVLLTFVLVRKNINTFKLTQSKKETFITSVQNFILINGVYFISLLIGVFLKS